MSTQFETMPMEPDAQLQPPKPRGCVFYGCLFSGVILIGALLCCGIGPYWFITSQVKKYTSVDPVTLPDVEFSEEQVAALEARMATFSETLEAGDTPPDLVLTADEINALISKKDELRGRVFVKIEDGEVTGDVSIPADAVWGGDGRFFNASASFQVTMEDGVLIVTLSGAEVNGEKIPDHFMQEISKENLAKDLYKDAENAKTLRRFESIEIVDDKIVMKVRRDIKQEDQAESDDDEATPTEKVDGAQPDIEPESEDDAKGADEPKADPDKEAADAENSPAR